MRSIAIALVAMSIAFATASSCSVFGGEDTCEWRGQTWAVGETFSDCCNGCMCMEGGRVECTIQLCNDCECEASGACASGVECGDVCCERGEQCVDGACACGDGPACGAGVWCLAGGAAPSGRCGDACAGP